MVTSCAAFNCTNRLHKGSGISFHKSSEMSSVPSQEEETNVYFIVPKKYGDEEQCSGDIKMAFQSCVEHDLCPEWITEDLALKLQPVKKDVFVFEEFVGNAFNYLRKFKSLIVGARCILACLIEGTPIPDGVSPVFTVAMRGLIVTSTAFDDPVKKSLMEKIEFMGGVYTAKFRQTVTHVVAKAVGTTKCEIATKNDIPVMTEDWVSCVWEASQQRNIHATDDEFMKYKCPIFHGLLITCSGLPRKEKEAVKELISKNGGEFSGALESERTKVLLISEPAGDKFKYAQRWSLPCLLPTWIHDSVKAGHALPIEDYRLKVEMRKCSTPEKNQSKFLPDFSVMSSIQSSEKYVDETLLNCTEANMYSVRPSGRMSVNVQEDGPPKSSGRISDVDKYMDMVDKLNLTEAKKAKIFLDGCNVYLSGFNAERTEKLRRVLNGGGATRFNEISDAVTHVILGEFVASDIKLLKESGLRPHVVTVEWLIQSIKLRSPAPEEQFSCFEHSLSPRAEPPSPLSKKGLQLLQSAPSPSIRPLNIDSEPQATDAVKPPSATAKPDELVQQYLQSSQSVAENCLQKIEEVCPEPESRKDITAPCNPDPTTQPGDETTNSTQFTTQASTVAEIFKGLMFVISGYPENQTSEMEEMIRECGGRLVTRNFKGVADYGIVPVYGGTLVQATNEIVTHRWLGDCYDKEAILPVMYYHQPVTLDLELKPLRGCVLGITTYTGSCRSFIMELAEALGALTQEMFARVDSKAKGAKASSHLICPGPGGHKYAAALKWKLPAVTHEWLLACAREGRRVPEEPYLVLENSSVGLESKESVSADKTRLSQSNQCDKPPPVYKRLQEIMGPPNTPRSSTSTPECHPRLSGSSPADTRNSPVNNSSTPSGRGNVHTPVTGNQREWPWDMNQPTPKGPNYVSTPETPYGAVFEPNPSPNTRKQWKRYIDNFPQFPRDEPLSKKRRQSTPLSELKRQCWAKFGGVNNSETPKSEEPPSSKDHDQPLSELDKVRQKLPLDEEPYENSRMNNSAAKSMESNPSPRSSSGATGINTLFFSSIDPRLRAFEICLLGSQLMELNEILTSASKMEALRSTRGTSSIAGTPQSSSGEEKINNAPPASASLPESADVNADCVEWVDPVISHNTQQELRAGSKRRSLKIMLSSVEELQAAKGASTVVITKKDSPTSTQICTADHLLLWQDREHCENIITALGGTVTTHVSYDPSASHLVCNRPARSEKLLCSIASGKWVLHRSFLDRSQQEGHFLQEESFEWGNPKAATLMQTLKPGSIECLLALAAHRWRMKLQNRSSGAFEGMKAIIHTTPDKLESYKRLIISGGGEVLDLRPPFSNPGDATVCLIDQNKVNTPVDFEALVRNDVPCVPPIFLNNFLVSDTLLDPRSCIIPQYKAAMESRK